MAESGASAAKVMRRELSDADSRGVSFYGRPDDARRDFSFLLGYSFKSPLKHLALHYVCALKPSVDELVAPGRYGYSSQSPALAH